MQLKNSGEYDDDVYQKDKILFNEQEALSNELKNYLARKTHSLLRVQITKYNW